MHLVLAAAAILHLADLNAAQVAKLDRAHTVVLLVGGILEQHGPYSPISSDGLRNDRLADDLAKAISARGDTVLVFPPIALGSGPFDQSMGRTDFAGSFPVRVRTLQAVFMDLADELGRQGFRRGFIVHGHGEPNHNRALDLAGDYFRATYGGMLVHLLGRAGCQADSIPGNPPAPAEALDADADSPHAGLLETARVLYLRPDLIAPGLADAKTITAPGFPGWAKASAEKDWPGYVGAPRYATAALGEWEFKRHSEACAALALKLLDGLDERKVPRYADRMLGIPAVQKGLAPFRAREAAQAKRQEAFLRGK